MRTANRRVLDHRDRGLGIPQRHIVGIGLRAGGSGGETQRHRRGQNTSAKYAALHAGDGFAPDCAWAMAASSWGNGISPLS